ncbi:MAG: hypothetical protein HYY56_02320 [Candidatus Omnitrophica bacterium]|nr:hypothetical protein [Candidatus Omnitrophota bacterium]
MSKRKKNRNKQRLERHPVEPLGKRLVIKDYIIMNLVVLAFAGIVGLSFYISTGFKVDGFQAGIFRFIFLYAFGCVFFVVSMVDYIMDRG